MTMVPAHFLLHLLTCCNNLSTRKLTSITNTSSRLQKKDVLNSQYASTNVKGYLVDEKLGFKAVLKISDSDLV